ncbi:MAG: hypothetical protein HY242_11900 [Afipia sp.]|nr:hypothetical protein [Afipia sp.]
MFLRIGSDQRIFDEKTLTNTDTYGYPKCAYAALAMAHIQPSEVISPKANWALVDVVLDNGERRCAYAIGMWNGKRRVGFRWNGKKDNPIGNPQSRGLPTWTMLDDALHQAVLAEVKSKNPGKAGIMQAFLGEPV